MTCEIKKESYGYLLTFSLPDDHRKQIRVIILFENLKFVFGKDKRLSPRKLRDLLIQHDIFRRIEKTAFHQINAQLVKSFTVLISQPSSDGVYALTNMAT